MTRRGGGKSWVGPQEASGSDLQLPPPLPQQHGSPGRPPATSSHVAEPPEKPFPPSTHCGLPRWPWHASLSEPAVTSLSFESCLGQVLHQAFSTSTSNELTNTSVSLHVNEE